MGILDDAIREHLDLKRKHGARDAELEQLEDEAFGPPTRPDEPDFPERPPTGEHAEQGAVAAEAATEEGAAEPALEEPPPEVGPPSAEAVEAAEAGFFDQELGDAPSPPVSETEPPPPVEQAPEPEAIAGEPTVEHPAPSLEPELDPEPAAEAPPVPEAPAQHVEPPAPREEGELEVGDPGLEADEEFEEFRETEGGEEEGADSEEDVLEETPEFLRDTPENERLWFEQGEPQDFDFDDEDEGGKKGG